MTIRRFLFAGVFSLVCSVASAQAPFPGGVQINGGWVPCTHPLAVQAGLSCLANQGPVDFSKSDETLTLGAYYANAYGDVYRVAGVVTLDVDGARRSYFELQRVTPNGGFCGGRGYWAIATPRGSSLREVPPQMTPAGCPTEPISLVQ